MSEDFTCPYCDSDDVEPVACLAIYKCYECASFFDEEDVEERFTPEDGPASDDE